MCDIDGHPRSLGPKVCINYGDCLLPTLMFHFSVRGTACGIASALSRMYVVTTHITLSIPRSPPPFRIAHSLTINFSFFLFALLVPRGGMVAPILGGSLLMVNNSFPVYASIVIFVVATVCVLLLKEDEGDRGGSKGSFVH